MSGHLFFEKGRKTVVVVLPQTSEWIINGTRPVDPGDYATSIRLILEQGERCLDDNGHAVVDVQQLLVLERLFVTSILFESLAEVILANNTQC